MSTTTESLIIDIQARNENKVKNLKTEIREATDEAARLVSEYGQFDKRTIAVIKHLAELKDVQGDINQRVKALSPDRFERIAAVGQGLVGGYQAFSGVMGLIGDQSKDWEKTMVKLQSLVSISQGLQSFKEARASIGQLTASIGGGLKNALTTVAGAARAVGAALGIGLILAAVTVIAAYWDDIKDAIGGVGDETRKAADESERKKNAAQEELEALGLQENSLKLQGLSEQEILKLKIAKTEQVIQAAEIDLRAQQQLAEAQIKAEERSKRILTSILSFVLNPIQLIIDATTTVLKAFGQDFDFDLSDKIAGLVFDPEATKAEAEKTKKESEKAIAELKSQRDGFHLSIKKIDQDAAKKAQDERAKQRAEEDRERKEWQTKVLKEKADFEKNLAGIEEGFRTANVNVKKEAMKDEKEDIKSKQEFFKKDLIAYDENEQYKIRKAKETSDYKKVLQEMELSGAQSLAGNLSQLVGQSTAAGKVFALAEVGISEGRALAAALANSQAPDPLNLATGGMAGLARFLTIAASITSTALKARSIIKGGGGGGGLNAPATSNTANLSTFESIQLGNKTQGGGTGQFHTVLPVESLNGVNRRITRTRSVASME